MLVQEVNRILVKLKSVNLPVLLVEQNIQFAVEVADYVYVLSKEGFVHECEATEFWKFREIITKYLGV
jgi:branched-chain amino acid transport system ATP-binding protein